MDTTTQTEQPAQRPTRRRRGRLGVLWGATGMLLLVLVCRFVLSDMVIRPEVVQRSCQGGVCVERVHTDDLLFVPGSRKVELGHEAPGQSGRVYVEDDPFDDYSDVTITWNTDGSVSLDDGSATLTWRAGLMEHLDD